MPALDWIGKHAVREHHSEVRFRILEESEERQVGDPNADNLLIQGDNLHTLKSLIPYYSGEVKCVYIDPPYNIGSGDWAYDDKVDSPEIRGWLNETVGGEMEDLSRHDKWLCMMYPRMMILHELMSEDGSIWMNIDDNEMHHARLLMDEIFGRSNFKSTIVWQKRTSPDSRVNLGAAHDYILVYAKNKEEIDLNLVPLSGERASDYTNPDGDPDGRWASIDMTGQTGHATEDQYYEIETPNGNTYKPPEGRCWAYAKDTFEDLVEKGRVWFGEDGSNRPRFKKYLHEAEGMTEWTWWENEKVGHNQEAKKELKEILPEVDFGELTPKPSRLIERILTLATDKDDLVLDSFAGSASTGHAVLKKNADDDGNRRFILVELQEEMAQNVAFPRLKRAVEGYPYEGTEKETLIEEKITVRSLKKGDQIYAESEEVKKNHADQYDKIRREMDDGVFRMYGQNNIEERKEGLGSGFRYYTLGSPLIDSNGFIQDEVEFEELARHIHYVEMGSPLPRDHEMEPPLVSVENGTAVYLLSDESRIVTRSVLDDLPTNGEVEDTIVYGDANRVSDSALSDFGVTFRQIPYDIRVA